MAFVVFRKATAKLEHSTNVKAIFFLVLNMFFKIVWSLKSRPMHTFDIH